MYQPQSSESRAPNNNTQDKTPNSDQAGLMTMEGRVVRNSSTSHESWNHIVPHDRRRRHHPPQEPEQNGHHPPSNYFSMKSFLVLALLTLSLLILPLVLPPLPPPPSMLLLLPIGILVVLMVLAFMHSDIGSIASTHV